MRQNSSSETPASLARASHGDALNFFRREFPFQREQDDPFLFRHFRGMDEIIFAGLSARLPVRLFFAGRVPRRE